jgi:hypothetical protein
LKPLSAPARYKLVVSMAGTTFENDWDVWVYPKYVDTDVPAEITVAEELTDAALARLEAGGTVLLAIPPKRVAPDKTRGRIALGFSSIFWNTAWTGGQAPHTLGILCDPRHPLFASFPTDFHSNWQWWYLVSRAGAMILDDMPAALRPTVQVIDDWVTNRKLGLLLEAKVGAGKLVVCSIDLTRELETDPVRRQFRHALLRYMAGEPFAPTHVVTAKQVRALIAPPSHLEKVGVANVQADSDDEGNEAEKAMDSDPKTIWHTAWRFGVTGFPHELRVEFASPRRVRGFTALPRQDGNRNGLIRDYAIYTSDDGLNWGEPVNRGVFDDTKQLKTVVFNTPAYGRYFKLVALSTFTRHASLAEFSLLPIEQ